MELLSQKFLNKYPDFPPHMNELGKFVFYRTYSRFLPEKGRRETWKETVKRAVEFNFSLELKHLEEIRKPFNHRLKEMKEEARKLFDNIFNLRQFLSGRTLWVGDPKEDSVGHKYPLANFNCSFLNIEEWQDLCELFYLLLVGTGVGIKCTTDMAKKLPAIKANIEVINLPYKPVTQNMRKSRTTANYGFNSSVGTIFVGDSKEGWVDALYHFFIMITLYDHIDTIKIDYNSVRPAGERLKTFGGHASGPEPLMEMFEGIVKVLKNELDPSLEPWEKVEDKPGFVRVRPIAILDIANLIGNNVVVGGVRRTAEIFLFSSDDYESLFAKYGINGFWSEEHFKQHDEIGQKLDQLGIKKPDWWDAIGQRHYDTSINGDQPFNPGRNLPHRRMSNNSVIFTKKPKRNMLNFIFSMLQFEGEPGFINIEELRRRRSDAEGVNPCAEIILPSRGVCNLTTVNLMEFVFEKDGEYLFNLPKLFEAQRLSVRAGLRMTLPKLELDRWDDVQKIDRLLGCSLTGVQDAFAMVNYSDQFKNQLLKWLRDVAHSEAVSFSKTLRVPIPLLITTVKPEGTLSQVAGGVSNGLHHSHSPYYIRRIRISAHDPLAKAVLEMGWTVNPEMGTPGATHEERLQNARTLVIDFPVKSGATVTKNDINAAQQLENYFRFQELYTDHNSSNTITVKPDEWEDVEEIVWSNWNNFAAVSFLAHDGGTYELAPYEEITEEEYNRLSADMQPFDPAILQRYETGQDFEIDDSGCENGVCPVR